MSVGDMPCAMRSGFTYSTAPAYSGRYLSANVDFPEPFGPATTWHIGLSGISSICRYYTTISLRPLRLYAVFALKTRALVYPRREANPPRGL